MAQYKERIAAGRQAPSDTQRNGRAIRRLGKALPVQALATAVAVRLELPLHGLSAVRADGKRNEAACALEATNLCDGHRDAIRDLLRVGGGRDQQVVRRPVKADAELLQGQDARRSLAPGDLREVSGAEFASFRGGFIAELVHAAQPEDGAGQIC